MARSVDSLFWSITCFPDWYRANRSFWYVSAEIPSKTMQTIKGGAGALMLNMLDAFWGDGGRHFERLGILVKSMHIKLAYGFITVDEKAEKETFGVKGASGLRMCM